MLIVETGRSRPVPRRAGRHDYAEHDARRQRRPLRRRVRRGQHLRRPPGRYRVSDAGVVHRTWYENGAGWFNYGIGVNRDGTQFAIPTYGGTFIYNSNPRRNFLGNDVFSHAASDGRGGTASATVNVLVRK